MIKRCESWGRGIAAAREVSALERARSWSSGVQAASSPWPNQATAGTGNGAQRGAAPSKPGVCFVLGLFFMLKQQEAPNQELGRQGVRLDNDTPPD